MTTLTKGVYASKRWCVVGTKEAVRDDGSKGLTLCIRRKRKTSEGEKEKKRKTTESLAEQAQQSREQKRTKKVLALAKEAFALNPGPPTTAKPVRAAAPVEVGALSEEAVAWRDFGTRGLVGMIAPGVLAEDDQQMSHVPLSGREGRTSVSKRHEKRMYRPGVWTLDVTTFAKNGVSKTPCQRVAESESGSGSDSEGVDTWVECEHCSKWRIWENEIVPATFFCCDQPGQTCATPQKPSN